ncbi:MAG: ATP-binding protein [Alphaproteobacteria bacterium]
MVEQQEKSESMAGIVVILEPHQEISRLLRVAKRKAKQLRCAWEVAFITTPTMRRRFSRTDCAAMMHATVQAQEMGATVTRLTASSMTDGIKKLLHRYVREPVLVMAQVNKKSRGFIRSSPLYVKVSAMLDDHENIVSVPIGIEQNHRYWWTGFLHINMKQVFMSLFAVLLATLSIEVIDFLVPEAIGLHNRNKSIIYTVACAFAAGRYGLLAGMIASVASFLALNILYIAPYYELSFENRTSAINLGLFLMAAIVLSVLGSSHYGNRVALTKRAERFGSLLSIHRITLNKRTVSEAVKAVDQELQNLLGAYVMIYLPSIMHENKLETLFTHDVETTQADMDALQLCWNESKAVSTAGWHYEPLITAQDEIGVLAIQNKGKYISEDRLLSAIADQVALILERLQVGVVAEQTKIQAEREKLRAMLLSSVSHDLKTPLSSVIGSLSVYRSMGKNLPEDQRMILINTALEEAQRLDSFITNILDMTRIESGQVELKQEWVKPALLVKDIKRRLQIRLAQHQVEVLTEDAGLEVLMDSMMTGQVIQNLLDNAAKYTPPHTKIELEWKSGVDGFAMTVRDYGRGIPEDQLDKIFDKYARIKKQDSQVAGTGLGLAIAKAVMQAQGGDIKAANHTAGGAEFTLTLPKTRLVGSREVA